MPHSYEGKGPSTKVLSLLGVLYSQLVICLHWLHLSCVLGQSRQQRCVDVCGREGIQDKTTGGIINKGPRWST